MTKAAELAKMGEVLTNSQIGGRRNIVINGAMQVAQRGTTGTLNNGGSDFHSADRFYSSEEGAFTGAFTVSNDTDSPAGFSNSTKWDCTTADTTLGAGDSFFVDHKIEAQNLQQLSYGTSDALKMTLSFFIKSNKTGTYVAWLYNYDANRQVSVLYTISVANTWEHKTLTFPADTTGSFNNDNGVGMVIRFIMGSGTTYTSGTAPSAWQSLVDANRYVGQTVNLADSTDNFMNITGVQLEVGEQATPFEHRSFGEELALCQRYYERYETSGGNYARFGIFQCTGTTSAFGAIDYKVSKRTAAVSLDTVLTRLALSDDDNAMLPVTGISIDSNCNSFENTSLSIVASGGGLVAGECTQLLSENVNNGYIAIDAEL
jgi:hypothetical protein